MKLTAAQLARYKQDGFLVVNDFVDIASCDRLRRRA